MDTARLVPDNTDRFTGLRWVRRAHAEPFSLPEARTICRLATKFDEGPIPCCCLTAVRYKNLVVFFGGGIIGLTFRHVFAWDTTHNTWVFPDVKNEDIVATRLSHSAAVFDKYMYVFGGMTPEAVHDDTLRLDLETWVWERVHVPTARERAQGLSPRERKCHSATVYENKMYILFGGCADSEGHRDMWALDLRTHTWEKIDFPIDENTPLPLVGHSAVLVEHELLVFGGLCTVGSLNVYHNTLFSFDLRKRVWKHVQTEGSLPPPRYSQVAFTDGRRLFVHGGDSDDCTVYFDDLHVLDLATLRWTCITNSVGDIIPSPRSGHAAAVVNGVVYVFGGELPGENVEDTESCEYSTDLYSLDFNLNVEAPLSELCARWLARYRGGLIAEEHFTQIITQLPLMPRQLLHGQAFGTTHRTF